MMTWARSFQHGLEVIDIVCQRPIVRSRVRRWFKSFVMHAMIYKSVRPFSHLSVERHVLKMRDSIARRMGKVDRKVEDHKTV